MYARGRIVDPRKFSRRGGTEKQAGSRGIDIISSELRREIANDKQSEITVTSREQIMLNVRIASIPKLLEFGIELVDVRMKRADFPPEIADSIYGRMQAERKRIADRERAEGAQQDLVIRAAVDREATIITAEANRDAAILRGEGEAEAIAIFASALERDPEFYTFQRTLEAYRVFLTTNTTVVLPANSDLFQFLLSPNGSLNGE